MRITYFTMIEVQIPNESCPQNDKNLHWHGFEILFTNDKKGQRIKWEEGGVEYNNNSVYTSDYRMNNAFSYRVVQILQKRILQTLQIIIEKDTANKKKMKSIKNIYK